MKKMKLHIVRTVQYPFCQMTVETGAEKFIEEEYQIVWDEAEEFGMIFDVQERVDILKGMKSVIHIHMDGIEYFYCRDAGVYWEELTTILDKKHKEE